jgi:UDP-N-acetylenolpyruvoylglucosamine reductase
MDLGDPGYRVLLVGACGMGMAPLAIYLKQRGVDVHGCDDYPVPATRDRLRQAGVEWLDHLHAPLHFDAVILSRAIAYDARRMEWLHRRFPDTPFHFRGHFLAHIASHHKTVIIAGSHGKTTTTAMLVNNLISRGFPLSYVMGGFFTDNQHPAAAFDSRSPWMVMEVDESDRTIESFTPELSVITNLDLDHVDHYRDEAELTEVFAQLIDRSRQGAVLGAGCPAGLGQRQSKIHKQPARPATTATFTETNRQLSLDVANWILAQNGLSAMTGSAAFPGVERRQELRQLGANHWMLCDYAHHPSEIKALATWLSTTYPDCHQQWVFQPHRYSRTKALRKDFALALSKHPCLLIPEYGAFEPSDDEGSSSRLLQDLIELGADAALCSHPETLFEKLEPGNHRIWVFAGAGDIPLWASWIEQRQRCPGDTADQIWLAFHRKLLGESSLLQLQMPLSRKITLKVGGAARYYAEPADRHALQLLLKSARCLQIPVRLIGNGSNLLVEDEGFSGLVIRLNAPQWKQLEPLGEGRFYAGAGLPLKILSRSALAHAVKGFAFLEGIPGTLGGALWMNAGAMGSDMSMVVEAVECLDRNGKVCFLTKDEIGFSYRKAPALRELWILGATLKGIPVDDPSSIQEEMDRMRDHRLSTQPSEPSAGCMFKNPQGDSAGRLIDLAGLKGLKIGGARVSEKHANFLVTERHTRAADIRALIHQVKSRVEQIHHIVLEQEIDVL